MNKRFVKYFVIIAIFLPIWILSLIGVIYANNLEVSAQIALNGFYTNSITISQYAYNLSNLCSFVCVFIGICSGGLLGCFIVELHDIKS